MNTKWLMIAICLLVISMSVAGCGPGQLFGSTVTPTLIPTATATPAPTFTPTPEFPTFTRDNGIEIVNTSGTTGEGAISFDVGGSENTLKITLNGNVPVTDQKAVCWFCLNIIRIAPNLEIPVEFFGVLELDESATVNGGSLQKHWKIVKVNGINVMKDPPEVESLGYNSLVLEYPQMTNSTNAIIAGDDGVTLKKEGKFFFLVEGSAHLEK